MARKTVKRVKTGSLERRFSMARAGFLAGARYATASAGGLFAAPDQREARRRMMRNASEREMRARWERERAMRLAREDAEAMR